MSGHRVPLGASSGGLPGATRRQRGSQTLKAEVKVREQGETSAQDQKIDQRGGGLGKGKKKGWREEVGKPRLLRVLQLQGSLAGGEV